MAQIIDQTLADAIEIIKGKCYSSMQSCVSAFVAASHIYFAFWLDKLYMTFHPEDSAARSSPNYVLFTNDKSLVFTSFFADFGPLDLGHTVKFCNQLQDTIARAHTSGKPVVYSCSDHPHARSNGAAMICAYMVSFWLELNVELWCLLNFIPLRFRQIFVHNCTTERAYGPFMGKHPILLFLLSFSTLLSSLLIF